jgi:hypothetical protein
MILRGDRISTTPIPSLLRHIATSALIPLAAIALALILRGGDSGDRSGVGMVVLGTSIFATPVLAVFGSLAFLFRRTVLSDVFGGIFFFGTVFLGSLIAFN